MTGTSVAPATRIAKTFVRLREERRAGLVAYVAAGDPDLPRSGRILETLDAAGADVIEVGVPFSDPLADGPVIQRAVERGRAAGATLSSTLRLVADHRARISAPLVLFTYANPILRFGVDRFARQAAEAGVDGVLTLDLPIEECGELDSALRARNVDTIFLLSPTSTRERIAKAAAMGRGFLYAISRLGVTGVQDRLALDARGLVSRIRAESELPVAVGFGVSSPEHVREIAAWADAAVVGSGLVRVIEDRGADPTLLDRVGEYVRWLRTGSTAS